MLIAVSPARIGKGKIIVKGRPEDEWRPEFREFNGTFDNRDISPEELMRLVANQWCITAQHNGYRHSKNFIAGQHLGLDLDNLDMSLEQIVKVPFFMKYASFAYTTPSHTTEHPKLRVIFVLDRPVRNKDKYAEAAASLVDRFGTTDQTVKDPARFLYGGGFGCLTHWWGNVMTLEDVRDELILPYRRAMEQQAEAARRAAANKVVIPNGDVPEGLVRHHFERLLNKIRTAPAGEKHVTRRSVAVTMGGYVAGGYATEADALAWLEDAAASNTDNLEAAMDTIRSGVKYGMGRPLYFTQEQPAPDGYHELDTIHPPLTPKQREAVAEIIRERQWVSYHEGMTAGQRAKWGAMGIPDAFQDRWQLGHTDSRGGNGSLTVPIFSPGWQFENIEYRHVGGGKGGIEYQIDTPSIWLADPDEAPMGECLLFPDTVAAAIGYVDLVIMAGNEMSVAALPGFDASGVDLRLFEGCDTLYIVTDPGSTRGSQHAVASAKRMLGNTKVKIVHLPDGADRLMRIYGFRPATMMNYVAQGTVA